MPTELTTTNVHNLFIKCLYEPEDVAKLKKGEIPEDCIRGEGVVTKAGFHPERLKEAKPALKEMLLQIPDDFHKKGGGGQSFLSMCVDINGVQWGEHRNMDELLCLSLAAGFASYCMPREMWNTFPRGMPYVVFDTEAA